MNANYVPGIMGAEGKRIPKPNHEKLQSFWSGILCKTPGKFLWSLWGCLWRPIVVRFVLKAETWRFKQFTEKNQEGAGGWRVRKEKWLYLIPEEAAVHSRRVWHLLIVRGEKRRAWVEMKTDLYARCQRAEGNFIWELLFSILSIKQRVLLKCGEDSFRERGKSVIGNLCWDWWERVFKTVNVLRFHHTWK